MFPWPTLLHLSERTAETRGEGVGGREPRKDWCKFIFKSQTDENNFHSPTAALWIFFQTKPEQNVVQITTKLGADQGCGIKGRLLLLAECGLGEMSLSPLSSPFPPPDSHSQHALLCPSLSPSYLLPRCAGEDGQPFCRPPQLPVSTSQHKTRRGRKPKTGNRHKPWHCTSGRCCQASDHRTDRRTHSCTYPGYFPINQSCQQPASQRFLQLPPHFVEQDLTLVFKGYKNLSVLEPDNTCSGTYCCAARPGAC